MMKILLASIVCSLTLAAAAHEDTHGHTADIGAPGRAAQVDRTVRVTMSDAMRFTPSNIAVREGETVRFIVKNAGKLKHEFVLGTAKELAAHAEMMKQYPDMQHSDPNMVTLPGGATGEVVWRFSKEGTVDFACLQVGHFEAGMKGDVTVRRVKR